MMSAQQRRSRQRSSSAERWRHFPAADSVILAGICPSRERQTERERERADVSVLECHSRVNRSHDLNAGARTTQKGAVDKETRILVPADTSLSETAVAPEAVSASGTA